jgi:hypothetical protein
MQYRLTHIIHPEDLASFRKNEKEEAMKSERQKQIKREKKKKRRQAQKGIAYSKLILEKRRAMMNKKEVPYSLEEILNKEKNNVS